MRNNYAEQVGKTAMPHFYLLSTMLPVFPRPPSWMHRRLRVSARRAGSGSLRSIIPLSAFYIRLTTDGQLMGSSPACFPPGVNLHMIQHWKVWA